jgi:hypothetical protein
VLHVWSAACVSVSEISGKKMWKKKWGKKKFVSVSEHLRDADA